MRLIDLLKTASFRLTALYLVLFVLSVAALGGLLYFAMHVTMEREARTQISTETNLLLHEYREDGLEELMEEIEERIEKSADGQRLRYLVQNPAGRGVFDSTHTLSPPWGWQRLEGSGAGLYLLSPLDNGYLLGVGKDERAYLEARQSLLRSVAWIIGAALLVGLLGGLFLSRRTLARVDRIGRTARAIGGGQLSQRIALHHTGDEYDQLARTLNEMFDRIEQLIGSVRGVSSGIAHELRTPLARLRNRLAELRERPPAARDDAALDAATAEVDTILQTFAALLRLAEVEAGTPKGGFRRFDLSACVSEVVEAFEAAADDAGSALRREVYPGIHLIGDERLMRQLLANLVENALLHGGPAAHVGVTLRFDPAEIVLEVSDDGPGIPAAERARVLRPFERIDTVRQGSGLGLALAAAIARLHGATLELLDRQPGLLCRLSIPQRNDEVAR